MCRFYCIAFREFMVGGKNILNYTNLFFPNDYQKNGNVIYRYFKNKYG